jgi:predicted transcriptional regulator
MTEKEIVLETIRALPDDCSLEEIAERIEFMAAVQKGLNQLDRGEGIPHDEEEKRTGRNYSRILKPACSKW